MHKAAPQDLLYDPMPRADVKLPPISEPKSQRVDAQRLVDPNEKAEAKDFLSNLMFS